MMKEIGITCSYIAVNKDDPTRVIIIQQGEEDKSLAMFKDLKVK